MRAAVALLYAALGIIYRRWGWS